ncbi:hypothetical protein CW304_21145 [Bacillus sp. UFRGS-B20]|nr:hypothetical protein CW304_21145 [Bacillus sp. UFRGS-B20]
MLHLEMSIFQNQLVLPRQEVCSNAFVRFLFCFICGLRCGYNSHPGSIRRLELYLLFLID